MRSKIRQSEKVRYLRVSLPWGMEANKQTSKQKQTLRCREETGSCWGRGTDAKGGREVQISGKSLHGKCGRKEKVPLQMWRTASCVVGVAGEGLGRERVASSSEGIWRALGAQAWRERSMQDPTPLSDLLDLHTRYEFHCL